LFLDNVIRARNGSIEEEDDFGYLAIGSIRVDHDLGSQERHELFGALTYYHDEQATEDELDLRSFIFEGGGVHRRGPLGLDITPTVFVTYLELSRESYYKDYGLDLRFERQFGPRLRLFASANVSDQDYDAIEESGAAFIRNGVQIAGMIGANYLISPTMRITGDYLRLDKNADADFFAYDRDQFRLSHTWLLGEGQFLLTNFRFQRDRYDEPDIFVSSRTRHDDIYRIRVTYGAPLVFFLGPGVVPPELEDVTVSGSLEYLRDSSNIRNFDYENWRPQLLLTKTWRF